MNKANNQTTYEGRMYIERIVCYEYTCAIRDPRRSVKLALRIPELLRQMHHHLTPHPVGDSFHNIIFDKILEQKGLSNQ